MVEATALLETVDKADRRGAPTALPAIIADWSIPSTPIGAAFSSWFEGRMVVELPGTTVERVEVDVERR